MESFELTSRAVALPQPGTLGELRELAGIVCKSGLVPKEFRDKPEDCLIAIAMGAEVGLKWPSALQSIAVINGRPSIWGDAALALVMSHPSFGGIDENECTDTAAVCVLRRKPNMERRYEFTLEDARKAGLLNKDTYRQHQARMLQMRARLRALRDLFPDALKGLAIREDVEVIEGEATQVDDGMTRGAKAVRDKLAKRKTKATEQTGDAAKLIGDAVPTAALATSVSVAPTAADVVAMYRKAATHDDIKRADELGARLPTEADKVAARNARAVRIGELAALVDPDTGELPSG